MNRLFQKYLLRNVLHYRKKYTVITILILALSFCLALTAFFYGGALDNSIRYARLYGDVQLTLDYDANDFDHPELTREQKNSLYRDLKEFFLAKKPAVLAEIPIIPGKIVSGTYSAELNVFSFEAARDIYSAEVIEGKAPAQGEICIPNTMDKKLKIGDVVSFTYKDSDKLFGSETFTVSGFFLRTDQVRDTALIPAQAMDALDPGRLPTRIVLYDAPKDVQLPLMTEEEKAVRQSEVNKVVSPYFRDAAFLQAHAEVRTAYDTYRAAREVVDFFLVTLVLFIVCLGIVAAISIVNVLFVTVVDRVKVIGTMFSFGLNKTRGTLLLATEILVFAGLSSLAGIGLASLASISLVGLPLRGDNEVLVTLLGGSTALPMSLTWEAVVLTLAIGVLVPFLVSFLSVRRILKGEIIHLIQHAR